MPLGNRPPHDASPLSVWSYACDLLQAARFAEWVELFSRDAVVEFPFAAPERARRVVGRDEIREVLAPAHERAARAVRRIGRHAMTVHETGPNLIICEFDSWQEVVATGERFVEPQVHVVEVHDGEITALRDYWSQALLAPSVATTLHSVS